MTLVAPLGLLGLLGLLVLFLIYILKPKYEEKSVSSTYIWKLSLKYKKKKLPFQWIKSSLLIVIQVLIITLLSVMIVQPLLVLETKTGEKIVILDASASMMATQNGRTRFQNAINEIGALAEETTRTDKFTVIIAGQTADFVIRRSDSPGLIKQKLADQVCSFVSGDIDGAVELAAGVLEENPNSDVILYTSRPYSDSGKIIVNDMSKGEWNAAILDFRAELTGGYYVFTAQVASFGRNTQLAVGLNINGQYRSVKLADCHSNQEIAVKFDDLKIRSYNTAEVFLDEISDTFVYDNNFCLFDGSKADYKVQIVSPDPTLLTYSLRSVGNIQVDAINTSLIYPDGESPPEPKTSGYDLYIYEKNSPSILPVDGSVMLVTPDQTSLGADIMIGGVTNIGTNVRWAGNPDDNDATRILLADFVPNTITMQRFVNVTQLNDDYTMVIHYNNQPVLLARRGATGQRTVVLTADLTYSNLQMMSFYFIPLMRNICYYTMAPTVDQNILDVGSELTLNAKTSTTQMTVDAQEFSRTFELAELPATVRLNQPGTYTITQIMSGGTSQERVFVRINSFESNFVRDGGKLSNPFFSGVGTDLDVANDTLDITFYLAVALLLLVFIEWGVQYREQY